MMFYKETNFKDTEIGRIPKEWKVVRVNKLFDLYKGTTPSTKIKEYWDGTIPFVTPTDITKINDLNEIYLRTTENYITEKGLKSKGLRLVPKRSLLFTSRATIGYLAINETEVAINQGIISLIPKNTNVDVTFFYYFLQKLRSLFENLAGGSTYKEISMSTFSNINMPLPSLSEQQKIAEILSTVDEAIQKTNEIIAKTERLKKGLMQELLTKGIGHKEFKDTEIGRIPEKWQIVSIGDVCEQRSEIVLPSENSDELFVGLEHITSGETRLHNYARSADVKSAKFRFYTGDILYGKLRPYLDKAVIAEFKGICSTDILVLKPKENMIGEFLIYILHSESFIKHAIATMRGTNHPRTSWSAISRYKFGLPDRFEQQKIAEILSTVDKKLEIEREEKARLEKIKQGLMDLLLTGKIRVRVS
jgi:type I restriction enzyme S subunit